jgi:hypothetical protein
MKVLFLISIVDPVTAQVVKAAQYKGCWLYRENLNAGKTANLTTKPQVSPRRHEDHEETKRKTFEVNDSTSIIGQHTLSEYPDHRRSTSSHSKFTATQKKFDQCFWFSS